MRKLWGDVKDSFYNPSFYATLPKRSIWQGVRFLFVLTLISITLLAVKLLVFAVPDLRAAFESDYFARQYPDELVITVDKNVVSTNVATPYYIPMAMETKEGDPKNLLVIDTSPDTSLETIMGYDALAVLTHNSIVATEPDGQVRVVPISDIDHFVMDEAKLVAFVAKMKMIIPFLIFVFALLGTAFVTFFSTLASLFTLLFLALIPLVVARVRGWKLRYSEAYRIGLYTLGPVIVIDTILMLLGITMPSLSISIGIVVFICLLNIRHTPPQPEAVV